MTIATERRTPQENRIPFDAFVEVGGLTGETFKARAIDLSAGGIHLQASQLPEIGTPLSCRFDSAADTVVCEGEVVWRRKTSRGGDFGLRFRSLDTESERVLRELCAIDHELGPGARVRLHLKGLAQPLHARVVESNSRGVVTASELAFLKPGTECSVEERDSDTQSLATLEDVRVRVDPTSGSPELTVTMGWNDARTTQAKSEPQRMSAPKPSAQTREPLPEDPRGERDDKTPLDSVPPVAFDAPSVAPAVLSGSPDEEDDLAWREQMDTLMSGVRKVREVFTRKSSPPPRLADERPRRVTAAPPKGGLHADGKHVLRRQSPSKVAPETGVTPAEWVTKHKRSLALGSAVALSVLVGAFALGRGDEPAPVAATDATPAAAPAASPQPGFEVAQTAPAVPGMPAPAGYDPAAGAAGGTPYAPVGVTDPSATPWAQAAVPAVPYTPPAAAPAPNAWAPTTPVAASAPSYEAPRSEPSVDSSPREERSTSRKHHAVRSFGQGGIASGKTLRLHMNAPIEQIQGEHTPTGFTVDLPNVRATEPAGPLAASDPRIESMRVRNTGSRAELVVEFKDGVPNYLVRAKDDVLEIVLADKGGSAAAPSDSASAPRITRKPSLERVRTRRAPRTRR